MKRSILFLLAMLAGFAGATAQVQEHVKWEFSSKPSTLKAGEEAELVFKAVIDKDWYLYSSDFDPDLGPMVTTFTFDKSDAYELIGGITPINPKKKFDEIFEGDITYFKKEGVFIQKIKVLKDGAQVKGLVEFQVCSDVTNMCVPGDSEFVIGKKAKAEKSAETVTPVASEDTNSKEKPAKKSESLLWFMLTAFGAGLVALLTPCVFPMIPMTVTFFTGQSNGKAKALAFGLSIVTIYTLAGTIVAAFLGPDFNNWLSTHWIPNTFFFVVFMIFALSFLGMFEITLPSSFVNKVDREADKGGYYGALFMGFTIVLVSFSCTGPIVGSLLVASSQGGLQLKPVAGMFAFGMAFALPFTIFAISPKLLDGLPKSGGWLNVVKVVLGFIEIALGFKFLSVADQAYHWGILDRDIYLAIWISVFSVLGFYLLGKLRMPHDSPVEKLPVPRVLLALVNFAFVIYLIPGLWGAPLAGLSGYLPPITTHDFDLLNAIKQNRGEMKEVERIVGCPEPKYEDLLHHPVGIHGYFDYQQALSCAKAQNKPVFIDFTGHGCVNCREMEQRVLSDPKVQRILNEDYVFVSLYVDDKTTLPEKEWYKSKRDGRLKKTIGKQNADFQITQFDNNAQPFYVLVGTDGKELVKPRAYDLSVTGFIEFLESGLTEFEKKKK
ncbi:thiol:disulfide interchange protein DsbD [Fulvitalea axinellae]|uniref:Thiol:disulfide interchange protein DsbD n=1 Tax=Fulvitalea axinellae TaxID=1182444 RepID=A0AAU9DAE3_9BACT|nr:thiol:disulfide interchange protein DsbD [Fulvitalea axinellae]